MCIVAQQLREPDVFEQWLASMLEVFCVWRIAESVLRPFVGSRTDIVVHAAILR